MLVIALLALLLITASEFQANVLLDSNGNALKYFQSVQTLKASNPPLFPGALVLSADGTTLLIGADGPESQDGAAFVFVKSSSQWVQQAKLVGNGVTGTRGAKQGKALALSGDGNIALVGGPDDGNFTGAVWAFARDPLTGAWTQQGSKLVGSGFAPSGLRDFGSSVAISRNGNTALIGAPGDDFGRGAVLSFDRNPGTGLWSQTGLKFFPVEEDGNFGDRAVLSVDGKTAAIGASSYDVGRGAVYVYTRNSSLTWNQVQMITSFGDELAFFGDAIAFSADDSTLIIGAQGMEASFIYTMNDSNVWQERAMLTPSSPEDMDADFGEAVALNGNGTIAFVGASFEGSTGAVRVFVRGVNASVWIEHPIKINPVFNGSSLRFGRSVSCDKDGLNLFVGDVDSDSRSVRVFDAVDVTRTPSKSPVVTFSPTRSPVRRTGNASLNGMSLPLTLLLTIVTMIFLVG